MELINQSLPEEALKIPLVDEAGNEHLLSEYLTGQPVLLVFLRHFGCIGCSEHVRAISMRLPELERLGVKVVFVGNGASHYLKGFKEQFALTDDKAEVLTEPTLKLHQSFHLKRSISATFGFRSVKNALRAFSNGNAQTTVKGDALQQGAIALIDESQQIRLIHREKAIGDFLDSSDVMSAVFKIFYEKKSEEPLV